MNKPLTPSQQKQECTCECHSTEVAIDIRHLHCYKCGAVQDTPKDNSERWEERLEELIGSTVSNRKYDEVVAFINQSFISREDLQEKIKALQRSSEYEVTQIGRDIDTGYNYALDDILKLISD